MRWSSMGRDTKWYADCTPTTPLKRSGTASSSEICGMGTQSRQEMEEATAENVQKRHGSFGMVRGRAQLQDKPQPNMSTPNLRLQDMSQPHSETKWHTHLQTHTCSQTASRTHSHAARTSGSSSVWRRMLARRKDSTQQPRVLLPELPCVLAALSRRYSTACWEKRMVLARGMGAANLWGWKRRHKPRGGSMWCAWRSQEHAGCEGLLIVQMTEMCGVVCARVACREGGATLCES